jgi:hypothetical protein
MSAPGSHDAPHPDSARLLEPPTVSSAPSTGTASTPAGTPGTAEPISGTMAAASVRHFGPYRLLAELARGGMGIVYHAQDTRLGREVALKVVRSGVLARPEELERFSREAKAVAQLNHPHIVPLYEVGTYDDQHYFTMELARAGSLADHRARLQADRRAAVALLLKVARALAHIHAQGLLHRDLKPANILLRDETTPLVSDFGLAKAVGVDADLTRTGAAVGTPAYMAPEQASGVPERVSSATDIWSLGVIAYELICGIRPFANTDERRLIDAIVHDPPHAPRKVRCDVDRDLETIVLKCLEKEPGQRYASAAALADDLEAWLAGEPIRARPVGRLRHTLRWSRRHWRAVTLTTIASALLVAAMIVRPWEDPEQALHDIEARLAAGQPVMLLDEAGTLPWSRELAPCQVLSHRGDPALTVSAERVGLLLLVPDPKVLHYRFEGEVRIDSGSDAHAGLFFCHSRHDSQRGVLHAFLAAILDFPVPAKGNPEVGFSLVHFVPEGLKGAWRGGGPGGSRRIKCSADDWYHLTVDASPTVIRLAVDGQEVYSLSETNRIAGANLMLRNRPDLKGVAHPVFWPGGGLGLSVTNGTASFRHIRVIPDPAQPAPR